MFARIRKFILESVTGDLPELDSYALPKMRKRKIASDSGSRLKDNQTVIAGRVWTWETPKESGTGQAVFEGEASGSVMGTKYKNVLDRFDLTVLGERFGIDDKGFVKCDEAQAVQIKTMRFIEGKSIDDVVREKTVGGKVQAGWSRSNVAKFSGCFTDAAILRDEAEASK
jgi:hypothetical protein